MIVAGHSKGGAEAILIAGLMTLDGSPPDRLVTCGCPKVHLGSRLDEILAGVPQAHYVREMDIVTKTPPGWRRPGKTIVLSGNSRPWPNVTDHRVAPYVADGPKHDRAALVACALAYEIEPTYKVGTSEAIITGDILAVRGTTFDGLGLIFRDVLAYPWCHSEWSVGLGKIRGLGWVHKGFLRGRGTCEGGAIGLYKQIRQHKKARPFLFN